MGLSSRIQPYGKDFPPLPQHACKKDCCYWVQLQGHIGRGVQMEPSSPSYWNKMNQFLFRTTSSLLKRSITKDFTFNSKCYDLTLQKTLDADVIGDRINTNNADRMGESAPWEKHFQRLFMKKSYKDKIMFLHSSIHSSQSTFRGKRFFIKSTIELFC